MCRKILLSVKQSGLVRENIISFTISINCLQRSVVFYSLHVLGDCEMFLFCRLLMSFYFFLNLFFFLKKTTTTYSRKTISVKLFGTVSFGSELQQATLADTDLISLLSTGQIGDTCKHLMAVYL